MAGSDAVIGWVGDGENSFVGDYFLNEKIEMGVEVRDKQQLLEQRVIKVNGQTAIAFERPLITMDSPWILEDATDVHTCDCNHTHT